MYNNDEGLRGSGEIIEYTDEQINEIIRCKTDIIYFAQNYFKIIHMDKMEIMVTK